MTNLKKIIIPILLLLLLSCGYEPILLKSNYDFYFNKINFDGEKEINSDILYHLNNSVTEEGKIYNLSIQTSKNKNIIAKDSKGDPTIFEIKILANFQVYNIKNEELITRIIEKKNTYNNISDKFELKKFENILINNLSKSIVDDLLLIITNID